MAAPVDGEMRRFMLRDISYLIHVVAQELIFYVYPTTIKIVGMGYKQKMYKNRMPRSERGKLRVGELASVPIRFGPAAGSRDTGTSG